ncbi:hypothetical protein EDC36_10945 [Tepidimonas ignava]|uniref:Uncharacterized protein n=1 Tax=Tepidimonas ignava TaxID=114249 RepID=A0A4R3LG93_9BURK|nr:hypothetical protein [Tepidimonas ignava]TCS97444.1 hypothetical protein EDC36_10945 [Tepidimonas ignava]TSE22163.1 hypothetical protein Tigna_01331 [Tepidimonas ignava]
MFLFRFVMFALLGAAALCFAFYLGTGRKHFLRWGIVILKWTVIPALGFFAVLVLSRVG